jgi:hypothetical protein
MNITATKVKRKLENHYGWDLNDREKRWFIDELLKDTIKIIDDELIRNKGISIKNTKTKQ